VSLKELVAKKNSDSDSYERVLIRQLEEYELVVGHSPASKDVNMKTKKATALEAVTRRQPVKIQQTEKA
jgi:hypothetical protein